MAKIAGDHCNVIVDNQTGTTKDITADITSVDIQWDNDMHDVTGMGEAVHNFVAGQGVQGITMNGNFNATSDRAHDVLKDLVGYSGTVTLEVGQNAAPTTGDPVFSGEFLCSQYAPSFANGSHVTFTAAFVKSGATAVAWSTKA